MGKLKDPAYILGVGCTRFGSMLDTPELENLSIQEMAAAAAKEAIDDAGIDPGEIDSFIIGNHMPQSLNMGSLYSQLSKWIGTELRAGVQISAACSTTNVGATLAAAQIASGAYNNVLVVGVEATSDYVKNASPYEREVIPSDKMWLWTDYGVGQAYSVPQGYDIFPTYNGFVGLGYCRKYDMSLEDYDRCMMELCRTRRLHGSMTPKAVIQETLEDEAARLGFNDVFEFWKSNYNPHIAWPSRLRSVVTACDGASAMVLGNKHEASKCKETPVELMGWGISVGDLPWYGEDPTYWPGDHVSFEKAYAMSGIQPDQVQYLHTHDCSHISGIVSAEACGYLPEGEGLRYAEEGRLRFDGDRPMSTHGGRHSFGHAWAASAGSDTYEAVNQIRGRAGMKQMAKAPEFALVHTHGYGMISTSLVLKGGM